MSAQASAGTWFMYEPAMNAMNGQNANRQSAPSATPRLGSATRSQAPNANTAMPPKSGPITHGARTSSPSASAADHPGGNWPNTLPPPSTTLVIEKKADSASVGSQSRPPAKIRACIACTNSSISNGRPSNTVTAISPYTPVATAATAAVQRIGRPSHLSASASQAPARHSAGTRRETIASTTPAPSTIAVPLSQPSRKSP